MTSCQKFIFLLIQPVLSWLWLCDSMEMLRHIRDFFGTMFKIVEETDKGTVLLSCLGMGYKNFAKKVT